VKNNQNEVTPGKTNIATPAISRLKDKNLSAEKCRSANWVLKNMAVKAARLNAPKINGCCHSALKFKLSKYPGVKTYHVPQTKISRNIMTHSLEK
jgi:hypothetical protein